MKHALALEINDMILDMAKRLNHSIQLVQNQSDDDEFRAYRYAAGEVMGIMLTEILNKLYIEHPDLKPPEMNE